MKEYTSRPSPDHNPDEELSVAAINNRIQELEEEVVEAIELCKRGESGIEWMENQAEAREMSIQQLKAERDAMLGITTPTLLGRLAARLSRKK